MTDKHLPALVSAICLSIVLIVVHTLTAYGIGHSVGLAEGKAEAIRPIIRQGELPYNVPVMLYKVLDDGRITSESALRTDYAGVLPFSTTGCKVPFDQIESWDYWTELSAVMKGRP